MKKIMIATLLFVGLISQAQELDKYQYAMVSSKFQFLDQPDQFRLNTLTKAYLESFGFVTYMDNEIIPEEVAIDNCNKIFVDVVSSGTLFTSKLNVVVRDCTNAILFTSLTGSSREKENEKAYRIALKEAFDSFKSLNYKFDVNAAKKEKAKKENIAPVKKIGDDSLVAKIVDGGYNVLDAQDKIILKLKNTSAEGVFIAAGPNGNGIFFNKMGKWYFEYYIGERLVSEILQVRF